MTIRDEVLSAYLDGELEPAEAERVRVLVARDNDLAERLGRLRLAGDLTREAFAPLSVAPPQLRAAAGANWRRLVAPAVAAIASCATGVVLGYSMRDDDVGALFVSDNGLVAAPAVSHGLDRTLSGAMTRRGAVELTVLYSFRDDQARACRVFRASLPSVATEAVACLEGEHWHVLALAPIRDAGGFRQAESAEPDAVAAAVDGLFAEEIDPEGEIELIASGWR